MKKLALPILAIALTGCGSFQNTAGVVSATTDLKYYYSDAAVFVQKAQFDEVEQFVVDDSIRILERGKKKFQDYPADRIIPDLPLITLDYVELRSAYMDLRAVVLANKDEYGAREWFVLSRFDTAAQVLDQQFYELTKAQEGSAALMTAIRLAETTLKLASLL